MSMTNTGHPTVPHGTGLLEGAYRAATLAAEHADDAEAAHRLSPETTQALVDAGFSRYFVGEKWGGDAAAPGGMSEIVQALSVVGRGCMSAAWCAGVLAAVGRMCSHLPEEGQSDLWGEGPNVPLAGSLAPSGTVTEAPGGWRVSGTWGFASGVDYAHWTMVGSLVHGTGGPPVLRHFVLPRSDYQVADTWRNVGLRGTGSNSLHVEDVFVPAHRSFEHRTLLAGDPDPAAPRLHRLPLKLINGLFFVAPGVGAVEGALEEWTTWTANRVEITGAKSTSRTGLRVELGRAAAALDAARLVVERAAANADQAKVTPELTLRATRDYSAAVDLLLDTVNGLQRMTGARGQSLSSPVQRVWRDVHCMAGHGALQPDVNADGWASHVLGLD